MSFGMQGSESQQQQTRGLSPGDRSYFSGLAAPRFANFEKYAEESRQDPGGLQYQSVVDQLLPLGPYGLPTGATAGVQQLGRDVWSNASSSRAQRGFGNDTNLEAVLGDAVRMASGQLIPLSTQVALERAKMAPTLRQAAFNYGKSPIEIINALLASSGEGTGSSNSFGFGASLPGGGDAKSVPAALGFPA